MADSDQDSPSAPAAPPPRESAATGPESSSTAPTGPQSGPPITETTTAPAPSDANRPVGDAASYSPTPGERIGEGDRFEIVEKVGAGGMGRVFRALDRHLDRTVAIKFILQNGRMPLDQLVAMLRVEAKATAKLNHENIVGIFDIDSYRGTPFLVMELLDGQSLDHMLHRARLNPLRATQIMTEVARGLSHAHAQGIIHRDLKPSNVFILRNGRAKILDFGISVLAPVLTPARGSDAPRGAVRLGTPAYMSPEQLRGESQDARVDIWAAGVMCYLMLTGRLPYTVSELRDRFQLGSTKGLAPSVRLLVPTLPEEADRLVATALSADPQGRFQSAREMMDALVELEHVIAGRSADGQAAASRIERRPLTILACHLEVPDTVDLDDEIDAAQRTFYEAAVSAVKQADGSIGVPFGGKFVCCFGYPTVKGNDAQRAVWAALQIAQTMRDYGQRSRTAAGLTYTIGVHSGVVGLPTLPLPGQGIPAMQGNVPTLAGRIADSAPAGAVVISQATFDLTRGFFQTLPLPGSGSSDDKHRLPRYQVTGELEALGGFEQGRGTELTPFVGRDAELAELRQLWDATKQGHGAMAVVSGEPGIGKSRLVQTLKEAVIAEHNIRLTCRCLPHFKNGALHPIIELILRSMDIRRTDTPEQKLEKLSANLSSLGFDLPHAVPLFGALLSIPFEPKYAPSALPPEQLKMQTLDALVTMLLATAKSRPTLFIVEDMHWVDHSTIELLTALIDRLPSSRVLAVLTARPEFHVPWSARDHLHEIRLDRLSPASALSIIGHASKDGHLSPEVMDRLVATTDGVPLFVEELTRMVVESRQPASGDRMTIPGTLQELLRARLDLLRGNGKQVAQVASVLGRDFPYELLRQVAPVDELSLQEGLDILDGAGILHAQGRPPDSKYLFKHALIQQAAYQSLMKADRQRHHRVAAEVLSEVFRDTAELQPELLAHHYWEAGKISEAITFWEKAGQRATARSGMVEAINHYTRALDALKAEPAGLERDRKELALLLALGSPLMSVRGYANPEVENTYARARELARAAGGHADIFPALQGLWQFYYVRGMLPASRQLGQQLLEIARESANSTFLLLAHRAVAASAFLQGDYETCRVHTQEGIGIYDVAQHGSLALRAGQDPGVAHGVYLAWASWMLGSPDQSLTHVTRALELARRLHHPLTLAYALCFTALMRNHRGEHKEAIACSEEALEITVPNNFALWTAWGQMQRGWALAGLRDFEQGIRLMEKGLDGWKSTGARVGFTFFPVTLAEFYLVRGHYDEAARLLDDAAPMIANNDEHFYEPELWRLKGELAQRRGGDRQSNTDASLADFDRGIAVARLLRGRSWELRLAMSRARLLAGRRVLRQAAGTPTTMPTRLTVSDAAKVLLTVYSGFTEGFDTADLRAARKELERLHEGGAV